MTFYGLMARLQGVMHILRGHDVEWNADPETEWCAGDIICHTCDLLIWCRWHDL